MTPDDAATLVKGAVSPAPGSPSADNLTLVSWDDLRHARHHIEHDVLEAVQTLADSNLALLLTLLAHADANAVAAIAAFHLSDDIEARAARWFAIAPSESLRDLALAAWLRAIATTWRRDPDPTTLAELATSVQSYTKGGAAVTYWWRILSMAPRLEHLAEDPHFVIALHDILSSRIGSNNAVPTHDELQRYRTNYRTITSALPRAAQLMHANPARAARSLFWHQLRADVVSDFELPYSSVCDRLYINAAAMAIRDDSTHWQEIAAGALAGGGLWKPSLSHTQGNNAAWLISAACAAAITAHRETAQVPTDLLESIWSTASTYLTTLFWDPVAPSDIRHTLAGLLASALSLDPATAPSRILSLANEVSASTFLDAIVERTTGLLDETTAGILGALRVKRAEYEASLDDSPRHAEG